MGTDVYCPSGILAAACAAKESKSSHSRILRHWRKSANWRRSVPLARLRGSGHSVELHARAFSAAYAEPRRGAARLGALRGAAPLGRQGAQRPRRAPGRDQGRVRHAVARGRVRCVARRTKQEREDGARKEVRKTRCRRSAHRNKRTRRGGSLCPDLRLRFAGFATGYFQLSPCFRRDPCVAL